MLKKPFGSKEPLWGYGRDATWRIRSNVPRATVMRLYTELLRRTLVLKCWGPIYKISYDYLTIMPKLRSTYDGRLIHKTSYEGRKAFLGYSSLAKS